MDYFRGLNLLKLKTMGQGRTAISKKKIGVDREIYRYLSQSFPVKNGISAGMSLATIVMGHKSGIFATILALSRKPVVEKRKNLRGPKRRLRTGGRFSGFLDRNTLDGFRVLEENHEILARGRLLPPVIFSIPFHPSVGP
jgi:hypothetical protein